MSVLWKRSVERLIDSKPIVFRRYGRAIRGEAWSVAERSDLRCPDVLFYAEMGNNPASNSTLLDCVCEGRKKWWLIAHSRHCVVSYIRHINYSANMLYQPHPQLCPSSDATKYEEVHRLI